MAFRSRHVQAEGKDTESLGGQCVRRLIELKWRVEADESRGEAKSCYWKYFAFHSKLDGESLESWNQRGGMI